MIDKPMYVHVGKMLELMGWSEQAKAPQEFW